jgi:transposase InsO family protein
MKYQFIQAEKAHDPIEVLCRVLHVARSGFYAWCRRRESARQRQNAWLLAHIRACYRASHGRYGSPRIYQDLRAQGIRVGRHRVARLMRQHDLRSVCRRRWRRARGVPPELAAANHLQRVFTASAPNQKWAGDITYVATREGWLYVAVLMDLYSRRIVGWAMDERMTTALTSQALEMALQHRGRPTGLLHHSDRGCQYGAMVYQQRLLALNIHCSMSRPGNCWDNAAVESFFATLKTELIHQRSWLTRHDARAAIFEYIEGFYNCRRRHSSLAYQSPLDFEHQTDANATLTQKPGVPSVWTQ